MKEPYRTRAAWGLQNENSWRQAESLPLINS